MILEIHSDNFKKAKQRAEKHTQKHLKKHMRHNCTLITSQSQFENERVFKSNKTSNLPWTPDDIRIEKISRFVE